MGLAKLVAELSGYQTEKEWFEFKENWFEPRSLGEYVSALSNSAALNGQKYGYFIWGISDNGHELVGTTFDPDRDVNHEPLKHYLARQLTPSTYFEFEEEELEGSRIVVLKIACARIAPTSFSGERFIRIGSSKENIRKYPEREAALFSILLNGLPTIDNTPAEEQDLEFSQLLMYYGSKGLTLNQDTFKKNLGLMTEKGQYNQLAQLLSDNSRLPLRVAVFRGIDKTSEMYSVAEFGYRCLLYTLDEVLRFFDVLNIKRADEKARVVERDEQPLFESSALREAIVNAFVHNAWVEGNEPMVTVFRDRVEILSRGTLAPAQTIEGFFAGESVPVNRRLSDIFLQLHISEKTGRGVPRIVARYGKSVYSFRENSILITIPFAFDLPFEGEEPQRARAATLEDRLVALIKEDGAVAKPRMAEMLGVSKASVDRAIAKLKAAGRIERVGSNRTGYWRVIE